MKKISTALLLFVLGTILTPAAFSQGIAINSSSAAPDNSAMLDVQSTSKGMLIPRLTSAQRDAISTPATGLLIFNTSTGSFWFKNKTRWVELVDSTNTIWTQKDTSVYLNGNQNVGIGTSAPEVRLHIERGSDVTLAGGGYLQLGASDNPNLVFDNNEIQARNAGLATDLTMQLGGGNIGIGTSLPAVRLQISNGTDVGYETGGYLQMGPNNATNLAFDNNEIQARNAFAPSALYLQNNGGDVQIGSGTFGSTDVHINNGKLLAPTTGAANLLPLCYGTVSAGGTLISGTPNVTVTKGAIGSYTINCTGITSSTIMVACPNDIHGGTKLNIAYSSAGHAFLLAVVGENDVENEPFSFILYNL
jgi:hypothetical protein